MFHIRPVLQSHCVRACIFHSFSHNHVGHRRKHRRCNINMVDFIIILRVVFCADTWAKERRGRVVKICFIDGQQTTTQNVLYISIRLSAINEKQTLTYVNGILRFWVKPMCDAGPKWCTHIATIQLHSILSVLFCSAEHQYNKHIRRISWTAFETYYPNISHKQTPEALHTEVKCSAEINADSDPAQQHCGRSEDELRKTSVCFVCFWSCVCWFSAFVVVLIRQRYPYLFSESGTN